ncbi:MULTISPECIES: dihydrodipicolinate synthase family protein [unclassified Variovorax]|uniref:dihydrodipicolinate synthase family protein n=1 Tax=unclassified Variovorax TaxID=663243 RepID=UPI0008AF8615|nr:MULTISPECIES: dihydrodipicolinate synthase family protein [unclassified Variovorax]SEK15101.1 4-hydroxy-tetrahydrodipicolinate synthase [Variovorax sp. OK202]SFE08784.1 4-hydroxy-tetrahydrodipicolinate synthase [Variovorax sp. OK212]
MSSPSLVGVFPVLPTPFDAQGRPDVGSLRKLVAYLLRCGVDGITYPGVASEVGQLTPDERLSLVDAVLDEVAGRVPVIAGVSSSDAALTGRLAAAASARGAAALMVAVPPDRKSAAEQIGYFTQVAKAAPEASLMLQNVPLPVGAGLDPEVLLEVIAAVPAIRYVKEETLPSGQRLTVLRDRGPAHLLGVFGGAGGRYITDELRRGAAGTMPAIELAEVHTALFKAHREGDADRVRALFTRMLPVLNVQAVFRWSLTKYVLKKRGLIADTRQRMPGPLLDALDAADVDAFLGDIGDLLLPQDQLP